MRSRNIKPGFFRNGRLARLPFETRLLFIGLWCLADREGRLEDRPEQIEVALMPKDDCDVDTMLNSLVPEFIARYAVNGERYIQVINFTKHQSPHSKEQPSIIPAPCLSGANTGLTPDMSDTCPRQTPLDSLIPSFLDSLDKTPPLIPPLEGGKEKVAKQEWKEGEPEYDLAFSLHDWILYNNPGARVPDLGNKAGREQFQKWCKVFDLMLRVDNRQPKEVDTIIDWCQQDDFWKSNILSPRKLREKYDQLKLKMLSQKGKS